MLVVEIIGFGLGVLASFLAWLVVWRMLSPRIELSPRISRISAGDEEERQHFGAEHRWRVKVRNRRRRRFAMEVAFEARVRFRNRFTGSMTSVVVGTGPARVPVLSDNLVVVLNLFGNHIAEQDRIFLRRQIGDRGAPGSVDDLDALLELLDEAHVRFVCIATDGYSGSRRAFLQEYRQADVSDGRFKSSSSLGGAQAILRRLRTGTHPSLEIEQPVEATRGTPPETTAADAEEAASASG